jgi:hypothetical protein
MFTSMNLAILQGTLEMAEKHVLAGERNIARQKELITEMVSLGLDVSAIKRRSPILKTRSAFTSNMCDS